MNARQTTSSVLVAPSQQLVPSLPYASIPSDHTTINSKSCGFAERPEQRRLLVDGLMRAVLLK